MAPLTHQSAVSSRCLIPYRRITGFLVLFLLIITLIVQPLDSLAQSEADESISVEQLIEQVLANNIELRMIEIEVAVVRGQRTQAGLWKNPDLSVQYGERRLKNADGTLAKGHTEGATITQAFEFPGKGALRKAIADRDVELAELGLQQFRAALTGKVKLLTHRYIADCANVQTAEKISDRSAALVELRQRRPRAGVQALLDTRSLEANLLELQQAMRESEQNRLSTLTEINLLRGRIPTAPLDLSSPLPAPKRDLLLEDLITAALNQNLLLKMREVELQRAQTEKDASILSAAPDFTVGPFYSMDKAGDQDTKVGISITMPLPLWNWNQGKIQASRGREIQADSLVKKARLEVASSITRLFQSHSLLQKQIDRTPHDLLVHLEEAADSADRHYRLGAVTVQTFLESQRQLLRSAQIQRQSLVDTESVLLDLELQTRLPLTEPPSTTTETSKPMTEP